MGFLSGLFIADEEDVKASIGKTVNFGEVLGKHSDVVCILKQDDLKIIADDPKYIDRTIEYFGRQTLCGYNPLSYME